MESLRRSVRHVCRFHKQLCKYQWLFFNENSWIICSSILCKEIWCIYWSFVDCPPEMKGKRKLKKCAFASTVHNHWSCLCVAFGVRLLCTNGHWVFGKVEVYHLLRVTKILSKTKHPNQGSQVSPTLSHTKGTKYLQGGGESRLFRTNARHKHDHCTLEPIGQCNILLYWTCFGA